MQPCILLQSSVAGECSYEFFDILALCARGSSGSEQVIFGALEGTHSIILSNILTNL